KIAANEHMWQTLSNQTFAEKIKEAKIEHFIDDEWIKKLYLQLAKTPEYKAYIEENSRDAKKEKAIMQFIWNNQLLNNEPLQEFFSDERPGWEDDRDMTVMLMDNFFKNNTKINFLNLISTEKREYAHNLMHTVLEKDDY